MSRTVLLPLLAAAACSSGGSAPPASTASGGGPNLVFVAGVAEAIDEATRDIATNVHGWLGASGIARAVRVVGATVEVRPAGSEDRAEVRTLVQREYGTRLVEQACASDVVCFRLAPAYAAEVQAAALAQVLLVAQKRVAAIDPAAKVTANGGAITIDLAKPAAAGEVERALARRARLEFRVLDHDAPFVHALIAQAHAPDVTSATDNWTTSSGSYEVDAYLVAPDRAALERTLTELARRDDRFVPPADREFVLGEIAGRWRTYYLARAVRIGGASIVDARVVLDEPGRPSVTVELDERAARDFERLTSENVGNKLAIVLDGRVASAPIINGTLPGGRFTISLGDAGEREANELAGLLRTGALPVSLRREPKP